MQAPGTFGYDHSKYRPPRDYDPNYQYTSPDEFGLSKPGRPGAAEEEEGQDLTFASGSYPPSKHDETRVGPMPPSSPAPFSHYASSKEEPPVISLTTPTFDVERGKAAGNGKGEDDGGAGCCKCVVM